MNNIIFFIIIIFIIYILFTISNYVNINSFPKIIWIYWDTSKTNKLSPSVQFCIENIKYFKKDWKINILTNKNINKYIQNNRILSILNSEIEPNFKSDLIRLYLIYNYGGVYLDASICLFTSLDWVPKKINNKQKILIYKNGVSTDSHGVGVGRSGYHWTQAGFSDKIANVYESWFIAAYPKNNIIKIWLDMFLNSLEKGVENSFKELKQNKVLMKTKFAKMHQSYHLIYFIFIQSQLLYPQINKNIISLDCNKNNYPCRAIFRIEYFTELFTKPISNSDFNKIKEYKLVKYTRFNRIEIDKINAKYNKDSFFYKLYH